MSYMNESVKLIKKIKPGSTITQVEILTQIAKKFNTTKERVRGTICGTAPHKLYGLEFFHNNYVFARKPARVIRKPIPRTENIYYENYISKEKQKIRELVSKCTRKKKPKILTMAASEGLCVKYFLEIFQEPKIYNIERYENILDKYKKLNLPTIDLLGSFENCINDINEKLDVIFYDTVGYACEQMNTSLKTINDNKKTNHLIITMMDIQKFRNHGKWVEWARKKFKNKNPTEQWIKFVLNNYEITKKIKYNKNKELGCRTMVVYVAKLKRK
jgi:hypothetical protein